MSSHVPWRTLKDILSSNHILHRTLADMPQLFNIHYAFRSFRFFWNIKFIIPKARHRVMLRLQFHRIKPEMSDYNALNQIINLPWSKKNTLPSPTERFTHTYY
jgi:hypothetical protein